MPSLSSYPAASSRIAPCLQTPRAQGNRMKDNFLHSSWFRSARAGGAMFASPAFQRWESCRKTPLEPCKGGGRKPAPQHSPFMRLACPRAQTLNSSPAPGVKKNFARQNAPFLQQDLISEQITSNAFNNLPVNSSVYNFSATGKNHPFFDAKSHRNHPICALFGVFSARFAPPVG